MTDSRRWRKAHSVPEWDERTRLIASFIPEGTTSVLEFGAWTMELRKHLPDGCRYTPCDIVDRGPRTIVCDLNAETLPEFPSHDVAVFSGVLEYVYDVPRLLDALSNVVSTVIASYAVAEGARAHPEVRAENNWVNAYTRADLLHLFEAAGFSCVRFVGKWGTQPIVRGERW